LSNGDLASGGRVVAVWNLDSGELKFTLQDEGDGINVLIEMSNDHIASCNEHGITFWQLSTRTLERRFQFEFPVCSIVLLSDGNLALGYQFDQNKISIFDPNNGQSLRKLEIDPKWSRVRCLMALPDSHLAFSCFENDNHKNYFTIICTKTDAIVRQDYIGSKLFISSALLTNERFFAMSTFSMIYKQSSLKIFETQTGKMVKCLADESASIFGLTLLKNGLLLSWCVDNTMQVWDLETGECLKTSVRSFKSAVASKTSSLVASFGPGDCDIKIWPGFFSYLE
jgi:WD40 repeat protein